MPAWNCFQAASSFARRSVLLCCFCSVVSFIFVFLQELPFDFIAEPDESLLDSRVEVNNDKRGAFHESLHFGRGVRVVVRTAFVVENAVAVCRRA
jgi:hypothetical protein